MEMTIWFALIHFGILEVARFSPVINSTKLTCFLSFHENEPFCKKSQLWLTLILLEYHYSPTITFPAFCIFRCCTRTNSFLIWVTYCAWLTWWYIVLVRVTFAFLTMNTLHTDVGSDTWTALRNEALTRGTLRAIKTFSSCWFQDRNLVPSAAPSL